MSAYDTIVIGHSPDVFYILNDSSGAPTIVDSSGNGHDATNGFGFLSVASLLPLDAETASQWDYGVGPLRLDGPYSVSQQPLTVEFLVKPASLTGFSGGHSTVIASGLTGGWACQYLVTTGTWRFKTFGVKDYDFTAAAVSGTVQHVVFVLQSSNAVDLYINGSFQQTVTSVSGIGATTDAITLASISGGGTYMTGQIQKAAVYKSALTAGNILAHYQAGFGSPTLSTPARSVSTRRS